MSQPPNQPYSDQPFPTRPDQPYPGQPGSSQVYPSGGAYQSGGAYPGRPGGEQPWSGPPGPEQPYHGGYSGPPYQGEPNPDVPASVPPQPTYEPQPPYLQPDYAPPGYPQPGYPQTGYPQTGYPQTGLTPGHPPAPKKKSRALPITLLSIALFLVLCVGGGTAVYLVGRNAADEIAVDSPSTAPSQPVERATTPPAATISLVEPKTLGGRPRVTDPVFADKVDDLKEGLALVPGASQAVGAIYGTPSKQDLVVVVAAKTLVVDPKRELDKSFTGANVESLKLTGITNIPAGPLGGVAKCAKGNGGGAPLSMCAWADEGSSGFVIWYFTSLSKAKKEFVRLRGQVEKKSN